MFKIFGEGDCERKELGKKEQVYMGGNVGKVWGKIAPDLSSAGNLMLITVTCNVQRACRTGGAGT